MPVADAPPPAPPRPPQISSSVAEPIAALETLLGPERLATAEVRLAELRQLAPDHPSVAFYTAQLEYQKGNNHQALANLAALARSGALPAEDLARIADLALQDTDHRRHYLRFIDLRTDLGGLTEALADAVARRPDDAALLGERLRRLRQRQTPPLFTACLPKSASVFILETLYHGLGKAPLATMGGAFPDYKVVPRLLAVLMATNAATHTHISASPDNLVELSLRFGLKKMIVHVRDPRQAIVSWTHFTREIARLVPSQAVHYGFPQNYLSLSFDDQLDWQIRNWLPKLSRWIEDWIDAPARPHFKTEILYTRFEDLIADRERFFARILDFYGIDPALFDPPEPGASGRGHNFRKGSVDEWREVFNPEQKKFAATAVPARVLERFGWAPM